MNKYIVRFVINNGLFVNQTVWYSTNKPHITFDETKAQKMSAERAIKILNLHKNEKFCVSAEIVEVK